MERILIESALRALLLALVTIAILRIARVRSAAAHHAAWTLVLGAMLVLPIWTVWGPRAAVPVNPPRWVKSDAPIASVPRALSLAPEPPSPAPRSIEPVPATPPRTVGLGAIAFVIYAGGVLVLLARLLVGTRRAQRLVREAVARDGHLTAGTLSVPVTVGWLRPVVILPERWETWPAEQLEAVLAHEREHVRRRDPLVQWFTLLNRAIFWFHPLAWWLEHRLASLAEDACDAAVLSNGHRPKTYCECLLSMARVVSGAGARVYVIGAPMPGASLSRRIRRILEAPPESRMSPLRLAVTLSVCVAASVAAMSGTLAAERASVPLVPRSVSVAPQHLPHAVANASVSAFLNESRREVETNLPSQIQSPNDRTMDARPAVAAPAPQAPTVSELPINGRAEAATFPGRNFAETMARLRAQNPILEDEFDDLLQSDRQTSDLLLTAAISYVQLNSAEYSVPITIRIAPSQDLLVGRGEQSQIDFAAHVTDDFGTHVLRLRDEGELRLAPNQIAAVATTPLVYRTSFVLLPGRYKLKVVARDRTTGRVGTADLPFTIPNLNKKKP